MEVRVQVILDNKGRLVEDTRCNGLGSLICPRAFYLRYSLLLFLAGIPGAAKQPRIIRL
jgi:hypothetical protein